MTSGKTNSMRIRSSSGNWPSTSFHKRRCAPRSSSSCCHARVRPVGGHGCTERATTRSHGLRDRRARPWAVSAAARVGRGRANPGPKPAPPRATRVPHVRAADVCTRKRPCSRDTVETLSRQCLDTDCQTRTYPAAAAARAPSTNAALLRSSCDQTVRSPQAAFARQAWGRWHGDCGSRSSYQACCNQRCARPARPALWCAGQAHLPARWRVVGEEDWAEGEACPAALARSNCSLLARAAHTQRARPPPPPSFPEPQRDALGLPFDHSLQGGEAERLCRSHRPHKEK